MSPRVPSAGSTGGASAPAAAAAAADGGDPAFNRRMPGSGSSGDLAHAEAAVTAAAAGGRRGRSDGDDALSPYSPAEAGSGESRPPTEEMINRV